MNFKENTIYYIRMVNGHDFITEISVEGTNKDPEYYMINPASVTFLEGNKLMVVSPINLLFVDNLKFGFEPANILFFNDNVSEETNSLYVGFLNHLDEVFQEIEEGNEKREMDFPDDPEIDELMEEKFEDDEVRINPDKTTLH